MKTAAKIIKDRYTFYDEDNAQKDIELCGEQVQQLMKQYAKEALQEAAEKVKLCGQLYCEDEPFKDQDEIKMTNKRGLVDTWIKVDKSTILSLIEELK